MEVRSYVLIETEVGKTKRVAETIRGLQGVALVDIVTGPYDVIVTIHAETMKDIGDLITEKIHPIIGVSRTVTCIAVMSS